MREGHRNGDRAPFDTAPVAALCTWFEKEARVLPWRQTRDPYAIWISEVMLQQTQVATVIPYYHRFLELFPTIDRLAEAPEEQVLRAWSGLGYYSRAKNLRKAARFLCDHFRGNFPRDREALLDVPGIGPYTAGAVLSIAFEMPEPLVDGNVQRVFARFFCLTDSVESNAAKKFFWERAAEWVTAARSPRTLNQALMELGATVCTKGRPRCEACPLQEQCGARRLGRQEEFPLRKPRREVVELWWAALVLENRGRILLQRNAVGTWWAGLWDLPHLEVPNARLARKNAVAWAQPFSPTADVEILPTQKHTVTHHRLRVVPCHIPVAKRSDLPGDLEGRWLPVERASEVPLSSLARKILSAYSGRTATMLQ